MNYWLYWGIKDYDYLEMDGKKENVEE